MTPEEIIVREVAWRFGEEDKQFGFAAIVALDAAGYVIVPKEPTAAMRETAKFVWEGYGCYGGLWAEHHTKVWRAMITAAQTQKADQPEG